MNQVQVNGINTDRCSVIVKDSDCSACFCTLNITLDLNIQSNQHLTFLLNIYSQILFSGRAYLAYLHQWLNNVHATISILKVSFCQFVFLDELCVEISVIAEEFFF